MTGRPDATIVGAGPGGCAAAIALAGLGLRVLLLDDRSPDRAGWPDRPGERLPGATRLALEALGVASEEIVAPCASVNISWGHRAEQVVPFAATAALHVRRTDLDAALHGAAVRAGVALQYGSRATHVSGGTGDWRIFVQSDDHAPTFIRTSFIVDATGRAARIARQLGARVTRIDTLVAALRWSPPNSEAGGCDFAVETLPGAWRYRVGLPDGGSVHGVLGPRNVFAPDRHRKIVMFDETAGLIDIAETAGPARLIAAAPQRLDRVLGAGWAAVGDAAASYDPIEGRGVLRALNAGLALGETIRALSGGASKARAEYEDQIAEDFANHVEMRSGIYAEAGLSLS